jgi:signal transduction histidine kinase
MTTLAGPGMVPRTQARRQGTPSRSQATVEERLRRVPLAAKILGAAAPVLLLLAVVLPMVRRGAALPAYLFPLMAIAMLATVVIAAGLVMLALRPLRELQDVLDRFGKGDLTARVRESRWADEDLRRVGHRLNALLDALHLDRERARELAEKVLQETDEERIRIADELYESTAQSLTALLLELQAVSSQSTDAATRQRLDGMRRIGSGVLNEIREMSHAAHPRVVSSRGLRASVEQLVSLADRGETLRTSHHGTELLDGVGAGLAALAYRVVQAALRLAEMGRSPRVVHLEVEVDGGTLRLSVVDDGPPHHEGPESDAAYLSLRQRAELSGGQLLRTVQGHRRTLRLDLPYRRAPHAAPASPQESQS